MIWISWKITQVEVCVACLESTVAPLVCSRDVLIQADTTLSALVQQNVKIIFRKIVWERILNVHRRQKVSTRWSCRAVWAERKRLNRYDYLSFVSISFDGFLNLRETEPSCPVLNQMLRGKIRSHRCCNLRCSDCTSCRWSLYGRFHHESPSSPKSTHERFRFYGRKKCFIFLTCLDYKYSEERVVSASQGRLITSRGPGTALEFALTLVLALRGQDVLKSVMAPLLLHPSVNIKL